MSAEEETRIRRNWERVEARIAAACARAGRRRDEVLLVAVTKNRANSEVAALKKLGLTDFGENRVQDAREKIPEFPGIHWHLIGHLQTNKAKYLPGLISCVHSVDSLEVAAALNAAWEKHPEIPALKILIQVNVAEEKQKFGISADQLCEILPEIQKLSRLNISGLMAMAPFGDDPEEARPTFQKLRKLRDDTSINSKIILPELSMGMTGDFEVAIEEGATMVRIGTALFEEASS
ncbi:YggS family pyridoxal phosphate-dependent enzyme [soil metagenome]